MVSLDLTSFIILGILIILNWILTELLFKPVMVNMQNRREYLQKLKQETSDKNHSAIEIEKETNQALDEARQKANLNGQTILDQAKHDAETQIDKSRNLVEQALLEHNQKLTNQKHLVHEQIKPDLDKITVSIKKKLLPLFLIVTFSLGLPSFFSVTSAKEDIEQHKADVSNDLEKAVDFSIMAAILFILLRKPISKALKNHSENIESTLEESKSDLKSSNAAVTFSRHHKENVHDKINQINSDAEKQARDLAQEVIEKTKRKNAQLKNYATTEKKSIEENVFLSLNRDIISDAMEKIHADFKTGIDKETDRKLIKDCLLKLDLYISNGDF